MTITQSPVPLEGSPVPAPTAGGAQLLLAALDRALWAAAELDPDTCHSSTPAGTALVALSAQARATAAALGGERGPVLVDGPGIVVLRDLAMAGARLRAAAAQASAEATRQADLDVVAERVDALLTEVLQYLTAAPR